MRHFHPTTEFVLKYDNKRHEKREVPADVKLKYHSDQKQLLVWFLTPVSNFQFGVLDSSGQRNTRYQNIIHLPSTYLFTFTNLYFTPVSEMTGGTGA